MRKIWTVLLTSGAAVFAQEQFDVMVPPPQQGAAIGLSAAGPRTVMFMAGGMMGNAVKGAPYSAESVTDSVQTLADGNRIVQHTSSLIYRDGEGRERREQSLGAIGALATSGELPKTILISDPVEKTSYTLDPTNRIAVKLPSPPMLPFPPMGAGTIGVAGSTGVAGSAANAGAITGVSETRMVIRRMEGGPPVHFEAAVPAPGTPGVQVFSRQATPAFFRSEFAPPKEENLGTKVIGGVPATGTRSTMTIPAGQMGNEKPIEITDERWYSEELQITVESIHSDPRMGTTTYALKNISRGEPPANLFQVPADYTVKSGPEPFIQKLP